MGYVLNKLFSVNWMFTMPPVSLKICFGVLKCLVNIIGNSTQRQEIFSKMSLIWNIFFYSCFIKMYFLLNCNKIYHSLSNGFVIFIQSNFNFFPHEVYFLYLYFFKIYLFVFNCLKVEIFLYSSLGLILV